MTTPLNFELWHLLHSLEVRHWYDVNHNDGKTAHELYTEQGVLAVGGKQHRGSRAIREFYESRAKRGVRTARHLVTNFQILAGDGDLYMKAMGIISLYAGDKLPMLDSKPAVLMADLFNEYVCESDGVWRYRLHILRPIFLGDDAFVNNAVRGEQQLLDDDTISDQKFSVRATFRNQPFRKSDT